MIHGVKLSDLDNLLRKASDVLKPLGIKISADIDLHCNCMTESLVQELSCTMYLDDVSKKEKK